MNFVREFMPIQASEYILENANGTRKLWKCEIKCKYTTAKQATGFINRYLSINDETLKISNNKKCGEKSPYMLNYFDRCHHDTRYEKSRKLISLNSNQTNVLKTQNVHLTWILRYLKTSWVIIFHVLFISNTYSTIQ